MSESAAYTGLAVPTPAVRTPAELPRRWLILAVLLAAPFLAVLDSFIVLIAAPSIQDQLHASNAGVQLVVAGYVVAYASLLITGGRLGDVHGRRRCLVAGMVLFSLSSLLAAAAPDQAVLVVARLVQGAAAALMYPQSLALIRVHFSGPRLASAMAAFGVALGMAAVSAQLAGGLLVQADVLGLGWRTIFLVNLPIGVAASALALLLVPESRAGGAARIDLGGVALVTVGLFALVSPLIVGRELGWPQWTWPLLAGAVLIGVLFVAHERRLTERGRWPLVPLDLFQVRGFAIGLVMTLAFYGGQISFFLLLSLYLQHGLRLPPLTTGLVFTPVALGFFAASVWSPPLVRRLRRHVLTLGALGLAAATSALSVLALDGGQRPVIVAMLPVLFGCGIGFGLVIPTLLGVVLQVVPTSCVGGASGVLVTAQQVAGAVGVALSGVLFFGLLRAAEPPSYPFAYALALGLNVALFAVTALLVQVIREVR